MNFKIRTKILFSFSFIILICIAAIAINYVLLISLNQKTDHVFNTVDPGVIAAYELQAALNTDIRAIEEYGNGYAELDETEKIVTASEALVDSYIKTIEKEGEVPKAYIQVLKDTLIKDEAQDEKVFALMKNQKSASVTPSDVRQALIKFDTLTQDAENETSRIINFLDNHRAKDIEALTDEIAKSRFYITIAFVASIILSIFIALITSSFLSTAIKKVRDSAIKLRLGDLTQRAQVASKDEIGDLANAFNQMAENIEKTQKEIKEADAQLKKKVLDLEKFKELTVGRELKMIELKEKLENLEKEKPKEKSKT